MWGCSKLDTTTLGSDLLPAVDNVNTFADTLPISTSLGIFNDTGFTIARADEHLLGRVPFDPFFGSTQADVFCELKPTFYPYYLGNSGDTIVSVDSVFICLKYNAFWGDSLTNIQLQAFEVNQSQPVATQDWDTIGKSHNITYAPATGAAISNPILVNIQNLGNWIKIKNGKDSVQNQIRIPLLSLWNNKFFSRDTAAASLNNSFRNDSLYRLFQKGIAIKANGAGNGLIYTNLSDVASRIEIHYRSKNGSVKDTSYSSLRLASNGALPLSATANNIVRNRSLSSQFTTADATKELFLQGDGTYANIDIPALGSLSNRIIHRAELIIERLPYVSPFDEKYYTPPNYLYLDLKDTTTGSFVKYKPIYTDLNPDVNYNPDDLFNYFPQGGVALNYFGGYIRDAGTYKYYNINITRYVQKLVTTHIPNYQMRLFAPYGFRYPQYFPTYINYYNRFDFGGVKLGGGANADIRKRMKLRIIWSKL